MRRFFAVSLVLVALPFAAFAVNKPPEIATSIHAATPVGSGELNKLVFHVYDASFWSDSGGISEPPYALSIVYDMDFTKEDLIERTVKELKHVSSLPDDKLQHYSAQLSSIWPDIRKGDRITAFTGDAKQTVFYYNGKKVGQIGDTEFTTAFFGIWLSPKSSEPGMRKELLGQ